MIRHLALTNFKCFPRIELDMGCLNVLTGPNGSGKSSVTQSLLLVRQAHESGTLADGRIELNGRLAQLGSLGEVYCAEPEGRRIAIELGSDGTESFIFSAEYSEEKAGEYFLETGSRLARASTSETELSIFRDAFNYLHAERIGPRKVFEIRTEAGRPFHVGMHGENALYILASDIGARAQVFNQKLHLPGDGGAAVRGLRGTWGLWMAKLFPGFRFDFEMFARSDQGRIGMSLANKPVTGQPHLVRPTNTGFGLSFTLGIVVAALAAEAGSLLIVENPEAHLHPAAQSTLGEFLARVAAGGVQVVVESHSEHVLNGARRAVKCELLEAEASRVFFFSRPSDQFYPTVETIRLEKNGEISGWPKGFFDQLEMDVTRLIE